MKQVSTVEFKPGTKEELLPNYSADFPCITTCYVPRAGDTAPWHWHTAVELFYIEEGCLEYVTPSARFFFPAGSGGFLNTNVLHMTRAQGTARQVMHLFDPSLIAGHQGSRIEGAYVLPLTTASQVDLIPLYPEDPAQAELLALLCRSFRLSPGEPGYELHIRAALSELWLGLLNTAAPRLGEKQHAPRVSERLKLMMVYVHDHYGERLSVTDLADAACVSERTCFNLFKNYLHTTPVEYINSYRLRMACQMLTQTEESVTAICAACGLGSSSYFAARFRQVMGASPLEYRNRHRRSGG